ncbi:MAG: hypothetical protein IH840_16000, partial [Candidatus Heimdallarchaeota archaeon]|nr:hypothetical protein [Candidatus Heimdallarchaeota archaeon]
MGESRELEDLVRDANQFYLENRLKEAKHKFLDAASVALAVSKQEKHLQKLAFENIARQLVTEARDIQQEILLNQLPLPRAPGAGAQDAGPGLTQKPIYRANLRNFLMVTTGGIPLFSYEFIDIKLETRTKLNDMLFSGAITAVNQMMMELLHSPITSISFEDGILFIHLVKSEDCFLLFYSDRDSKDLRDRISTFSQDYISNFSEKISTAISTALSLDTDAEIIS